MTLDSSEELCFLSSLLQNQTVHKQMAFLDIASRHFVMKTVFGLQRFNSKHMWLNRFQRQAVRAQYFPTTQLPPTSFPKTCSCPQYKYSVTQTFYDLLTFTLTALFSKRMSNDMLELKMFPTPISLVNGIYSQQSPDKKDGQP